MRRSSAPTLPVYSITASTAGPTSTRAPAASTTSPSSRRVRTGPGQCPFAGVNASRRDQSRPVPPRADRQQRHLPLRAAPRRRPDRAPTVTATATISTSTTTSNSSSSITINQLLAALPAAPAFTPVLASTSPDRRRRPTMYHRRPRSPGPTARPWATWAWEPESQPEAAAAAII